MAEQPFFFDIEDNETGKVYRVETDDPKATFDEAVSYLSSLPENEWAQFEYNPTEASAPVTQPAAPSAVPVQPSGAVSINTPQQGVDLKTTRGVQTTDTTYKLAMDDPFAAPAVNKIFLSPEGEQAVIDMINYGDQSFEEIDQYLQQQGYSPASAADYENWAQVRKAAQEGRPATSVKYGNPFEGLNDTRLEEEVRDWSKGKDGLLDDGVLAQLGRGAVEALMDPASAMGYIRRKINMAFNYRADELRRAYPDLTDEQFDELYEQYVGWMQGQVAQAASSATTNDNFWLNLAGQFVSGMTSDPANLFPFGITTKAGTRVGRAFEKAAEGTAVNAAVDVIYQNLAVQDYAQNAYQYERTLMSAGFGAAFSGSIQGVFDPRLAPRVSTDATRALNNAFPSFEPIVAPDAKKGSQAYKDQMGQAIDGMLRGLETVTEGWTNRPDIAVLYNFRGVRGVDNGAMGVYRKDGQVLINAEAVIAGAKKRGISVNDMLTAVTYHESLGHYGLAQRYGAELEGTMLRLYDQGNEQFRTEVDEWLAKRPDAYSNLNEQSRLANAVEEVLAGWSEKNGLLDRTVVDIVSDWLRNMGRNMGRDIKYNLAEIRGILGTAQRTVTEGARVDPEGVGGVKYIFGGIDQLLMNTATGEGNLTRSNELIDDFKLTFHQYEQEMSRATTPEEILRVRRAYQFDGNSREVTGWFIGPDGKWRFEISDEQANVYAQGLPPVGQKWKLDQVLYHPELFDLYPSLADVDVSTFDGAPNEYGSFSPLTMEIKLNSKYQRAIEEANNTEHGTEEVLELVSTLIHEIQHGVQTVEGFATGGGPRSALRQFPDELLIRGGQNFANFIEKIELAKLKTVRNTAEILGQTPEYRNMMQLVDVADGLHARFNQSQKVLGDSHPETRSLSDQWLKSLDDYRDAKHSFHKLLGIDSPFATIDSLTKSGIENPRQSLDDYFVLMSAIQNPDRMEAEIRSNENLVKGLRSVLDGRTKLDDNSRKTARQLLESDEAVKFDAYQHLFGEIEARDVEARMRLNAKERRETVPYLSQGIPPENWAVTGATGTAMSQVRRGVREPETTSAGFIRRTPDRSSVAAARKQFWEMKQRAWDEGVEAGGNPKYMRDDWELTTDNISVVRERGSSLQADGKTVPVFIARSPSGEVLATVRRRAFESNTQAEQRVKQDALRNAQEMRRGENLGGVNKILSKKYMRDDWDPDSLGADDIIYAQDTEALFEAILRNSPKEQISFEAIEANLLARGLSPSQIQRLAKVKPGQLTQRAGAFDLAMRKLDERRMRLQEDMVRELRETGNFDPVKQVEMFNTYLAMQDIGDKAFAFTSEAGRLLNFTKRLAFTRRKTEAAFEYFREKGVEHLADPEQFMKFMAEIEKDIPNTGKNQERYGVIGDKLSVSRNVMSYINVPRAVMSSMDLSAPFRQGIVFVGTGNFWRSFANMFNMLGRSGEDNYAWLMRKIANDPNYELMVKARLAFSELDGRLDAREESFQTDLAQQIPVIGKGVKASERAYAGFLNKLRADMFNQYVQQYKDAGVELSDELLLGLGRFINAGTGRAELPGGLKGSAGLLNATFFSPRLIASRVQMLNPVFYARLPEPVRVEAMKQMLAFGTIATMFNRMIEQMWPDEAEVETDPRSTDFGKIKFDDSRFDTGGGFYQYLTFGARSMAYFGNSILQSSERFTGKDTLDFQTHEIKSGTGAETKFNRGQEYGGREYIKDGVIDFFRNKLSPQMSFAWDMVSGTDAIGKPVTVEGSLLSRLVPMTFSDAYEAYKLKGGERAALTAASSLFGAGVSTYILPAYDKDQELQAPVSYVDNTLIDQSNEFVSVKEGKVDLKLPARKMWKDTINNYFKYYVDAGIEDARKQLGRPDLKWEDLTKEQKLYIIEWAKKDAQSDAREDMKIFLEPYTIQSEQ